MPKCPDCKTENSFVYVGAIEVECTYLHCQHFNQEAHNKFIGQAQEELEQAELEELYKNYLQIAGVESD